MKYHEIKSTRITRIISGLKALIDVIEYIMELPEVVKIDIHINQILGNSPISAQIKIYSISANEIQEELKRLREYYQNPTLVYKMELIEVTEQYRGEVLSSEILELYDKLVDYAKNVVINTLKQYLNSGNEYFIAILGNGELVILEGWEEKVTVPFPPGIEVIMTGHTHPKTPCIPSKKDLESTIKLLSDQGIGSIIVSPYCTLCIYRRGPFIEEDYYELIKLSRELGKVESLAKALSILNSTSSKLKYVKIIML